jgi:hypothetical protein
MLRSTASKVMWVGRATVFMVGLAVILALVLGVASAAFGANGQAWILGQNNVATAITKLAGAAGVNGPMLQLINNNADANDTALDLRVQSGESPMTVNSATKVANLNADRLDGKDFGALGAQEVFGFLGSLPQEKKFTSKGGTLVITASGSGFRGTGSSLKEGYIGMDVLLDGLLVGTAQVYTNERNSHKAFVPALDVVSGVPAGEHTIRLEEYRSSVCNTPNETTFSVCTDTDLNDNFQVLVTEIPD